MRTEQLINAPERNYAANPRYDYGYQSLHFNLKQQKEAMKPTQIMMAVRIGGIRYRVYIKNKVEPAFWNNKAECCKNGEFLSARVNARATRINKTIDTIKRKLDTADMLAAELGCLLTIDDLRSVIKTVTESCPSASQVPAIKSQKKTKEPAACGNDPIMILRSIADNFEAEISDKGGKGASSSRKTYLYGCQRLEDYTGEKAIVIHSFAQLNRSFYHDFAQWLNKRSYMAGNTKKQYCATTVQNTLRCISNLHHKAYEAGYTDVPECRCSAFHFAVKQQSGKVYLSEKELDRIGSLSHLGKTEEGVRDMFYLASYTGLRISDINQLNDAVIADGTIRLFQKKTHGYVAIPILKEVAGIIEKYQNLPKGFPKISPGSANRLVKQLCQKAGIDSLVQVEECRGGSLEQKTCPKYELVSFHTARRSCITNLFRRGYSPNYLMSMSGHKSVSSFQRYIKSDSEEITSDFIKELKRQKALSTDSTRI